MRTRSFVPALVRYNLRILPGSIWAAVALLSLWQAFMTRNINNAWTIHGFNATQLHIFPLFFCAMIGSLFFQSTARYCGGQIPDTEFLLTRPVLRRTAYLSRISIYYILMLTPFLSGVYTQTSKPDLRVDFYHDYLGTEPAATTAGKIKFYREQFPDSQVVHKPLLSFNKEAYDTTLVIPSGALLVACWDLFVAMVFALILQISMFFTSPSKLRGMSFLGTLFLIYFATGLLFIVIFSSRGVPPTPLFSLFELAFFIFVRHSALAAIYALAAFVFVQWIALKRIRSFEVI